MTVPSQGMFILWTWLFIAFSPRSHVCRMKLENFRLILSNTTRAPQDFLQFSSGTSWPCMHIVPGSFWSHSGMIWPNCDKLSTSVLTSVNAESKFLTLIVVSPTSNVEKVNWISRYWWNSSAKFSIFVRQLTKWGPCNIINNDDNVQFVVAYSFKCALHFYSSSLLREMLLLSQGM